MTDKTAESPPENKGRGEPLLWTRSTRRDAAVDLLTAYKWPISIVVGILGVLVVGGIVAIPSLEDVPPEAWSALFYAGVGILPGTAVAIYLYRRWHTVDGQEVWDIDPVTDDHRHLRIGTELWEDLEVRSPWGEIVGRQELHRCEINGRSGFEMMDFRVQEDGTPVCVATMMGEASTAMLRTYRRAVIYSRRRLSRKANAAMMEKANREPIAREIAERVVMHQIRTAQKSGTPGAEEIQHVVDDTLAEMDLQDPMRNDDLDGLEEWQPGDAEDDADLEELQRKKRELVNGGGPK